jgi:hypothetical protein
MNRRMSAGDSRGLEYLATHFRSSLSEDPPAQMGPCHLDPKLFHEVERESAASTPIRQILAVPFLPKVGFLSLHRILTEELGLMTG